MLKYFSAYIFLSVLIFANGKPTSIDKEIMNLSLNYDFDKADQLLAEEFNKTENLKNHFIFLNVELLKVIKATDEVPYNQKRAIKDSLNNILIKYAENVVEKYEDKELSIYEKFYFGSIHGVLGRLYGVSKSWTSAFSSGKEGRDLMEEIIEEKPDFTDAYLIIGMMNYYADRMGGFIEFVASILGLSGDRDIGLTYLEKVEKEGDFNNWQAAMILIELYSRLEGNKFASLPLLEKMVERFPDNTHFLNWYCYDLMSMHYFNKLEKIINQNENKVNDYIKAAFYHNKGEYGKSNKLYEKLLSEKSNIFPWIHENAKYLRALNHFYLDNDKIANELKEGLNENYTNQINTFIANKELTKKIFEFRKSVLFDNQFEINKHIADSINYKKTNRSESVFNYYLGVYYFKIDNLLEAEKQFLNAKKLNFKNFGYPSIRYLIHIYKTIDVSEDKVENLLDEISDQDNESLEFFAQDLEKKYDL